MSICLPFEILTSICEEVDDVRDLFHFRTASRCFCAAATPIVFRVLSVTSTRESAQNIGRLFDLTDIAAHVWEVSYHDTGADMAGRLRPKYGFTRAVHELANSFSRIHRLPRLKTINLRFSSRDGGHHDVALQVSILGALTTSFSIRTPPDLISLSLHNLRSGNLSPLASLPFQTVLPALRRFQLSVLLPSTTNPVCWRYFWSTLCPRQILAPMQHALTELALHTDTNIGASCRLSLEALHFPHLCTLSLRKLIFEPSVGVESFVLRHAATLARLELLECKLPGNPKERLSSGNLSPSTVLTKNQEPRHGGWDHVWDRFAAELTALIALHVDESRRSWGSVDRYAVSDSERITCWEFEIESRNSADTEALRRFHVTVAARRRRAGYPEGEVTPFWGNGAR